MRIALDLDMTLNNMAYTWMRWLNRQIAPDLTLEKVRYFGYIRDAYGKAADAYWKDPLAYDEIVPLYGATEFVVRLKLLYEVLIITHTPEGQQSEVKDAWIRRNFGDIQVIHSGTKHHHTKDCILIDDNPAHVQRHVRHNKNCHGIVFNHQGDYPWAFSLTGHPREQVVQGYYKALKQVDKICSM